MKHPNYSFSQTEGQCWCSIYARSEVDSVGKLHSETVPTIESGASTQAYYCGAAAKTINAFSKLRMLNDNSRSLTFEDVIRRARRVNTTFQKWQSSGALIKGISARLSNGKEINLEQSNCFSFYGVQFRNSFARDAVLHVYKKADKQFGEVLLLSVRLQGISSSHEYERTYANGQKISLNATRSKNGQLLVGLDCTNPTSKQKTVAAAPAGRLRSPLAEAWQGRFKNIEIIRKAIPAMAYVSAVVALCAWLWLPLGEPPVQIPSAVPGGIEIITVPPSQPGDKHKKRPQNAKPGPSAKSAPAKDPAGRSDMSKASVYAETAREFAGPGEVVNQPCSGARKILDRRIEQPIQRPQSVVTTNADNDAGKPALDEDTDYPKDRLTTPPP